MTTVSDDIARAIEHAEEHVADAAYVASADEKKHALSEGMREIEELLRVHPNNADLKYYMGYLWYSWPERADERRAKVYSYLKDAQRDDPRHVGARLYLGFQQFDDQRYEDALATFQSIDLDALGKRARSWSRLKVEELVVCCKLRIDWRTVKMEEIKELRWQYTEYKEEAVPPAPLEIARATVAMCRHVDAKEPDILVREVIALIEVAEGDGGGSLAPELLQLRAWLTGTRQAS